MRILLIFIAFPLIVGNMVLAAETRPFIAGTFHVNVPTSGFEDGNLTHHQGGARTGIGQEVDAGLTTGSLAPYLGFRWAHFDASGHVQVGDQTYRADGVWRLFRWVLGLRWAPVDREGVVPTIGGGLTWERTDIVMRAADTPVPIGTVKMSGPSLGWFAESGLELPAGRRVDLIGTVQFHRQISPVNSNFGGVLHGRVPISHATIAAGLKINLF